MKYRLLIFLLSVQFSLLSQEFTFSKMYHNGSKSSDRLKHIELSPTKNILAVGQFGDSIQFDLSSNSGFDISLWGDDIFILNLNSNLEFRWVKKISGQNKSVNDFAIDSNGNIYIVGDFGGTIDFDPSTSNYSITSPSHNDSYILKLDSNGSFLWVKTFDGSNSQIDQIELDNDNNIIIAGSYKGQIDFDPSASIYNSNSGANSEDLFVLKLDSNGMFNWVDIIWGSTFSGKSNPTSLIVDKLNRIYIGARINIQSGYLSKGTRFISTLDSGSYILQLFPNGLLKNSLKFSFIDINSISILNNHIVSVGSFSDSIDFDPSTSEFKLMTSSISDTDIFILSLDSSMSFNWAHSIGGIYADEANTVQITEENNIITTGYFKDFADFDPDTSTVELFSGSNSKSSFICVLDSNGKFVWARNLKASYNESNSLISIDNNIFWAGNFKISMLYNPNPISYANAKGELDFYIQKLVANSIGLESLSISSYELILFPNPTNGQVFIENILDSPSSTIKVYDASGSLLEVFQFKNEKVMRIELDYPSGIYFVQVSNGSKYHSAKVFLSR